jgi:four helix bundle protein
MTYSRFEDVPVWQEAARLYDAAEDLLEDSSFHASRGYRDQLDRAALSVSNNIAEGFERGTTNELLQFLYIARGSSGEVRSMLILKLRRARLPEQKSQFAKLAALAESCSRRLRGWADSLQNSDIKGQRHQTDKSRQEDDQKKRAEACRKELLSRLPPGRPLRKAAEEKSQI